jgi:hypothetical protein
MEEIPAATGNSLKSRGGSGGNGRRAGRLRSNDGWNRVPTDRTGGYLQCVMHANGNRCHCGRRSRTRGCSERTRRLNPARIAGVTGCSIVMVFVQGPCARRRLVRTGAEPQAESAIGIERRHEADWNEGPKEYGRQQQARDPGSFLTQSRRLGRFNPHVRPCRENPACRVRRRCGAGCCKQSSRGNRCSASRGAPGTARPAWIFLSCASSS